MRKMVLFSAAVLSAGMAMAANPTKVTEARMSTDGLRAERMSQQVFSKTAVTLRMNDKSNVVASKRLKDGSSIDLVRGNDGYLYKVLNRGLRVSDKIAPSKSRVNAPAVMKADEDATLFEGFESYGGTSRGWIPEGWSQMSKTDPAHVAPEGDGTCLVWEASKGDGFTEAYSGDYVERVQVSIADFTTDPITFAEQQDEWLVTKTITPKAGDFLTFQLYYSPCFTLLDGTTMEFTAVNNILEVLVTTDDGKTWEKVWDVLDDARSYTEDELWDDGASFVREYHPMLVNISKYAGKNIKIAFRYYGINGESMMLDDVKVGEATPTAAVTAPNAVFPIGLSLEGYNLSDGSGNVLCLALAPYKTSLEWTNVSPAYESCTWTYPDNEGNESTSSSKNLEAPEYSFARYDAPSLVTKIGSKTSDAAKLYDAVQYGGSVMIKVGDNYKSFDAAMYDLNRLVSKKATFSRAGDGVFGMGATSDATWNQQLLKTEGLKVTGMGMFIPQPAAPYTLSSANVAVYYTDGKLTDKSQLKATVYKVEDDGSFTAMAEGYCTPSEIYKADDKSYPKAVFYFEREIDGLPTQAELFVDYPIVIQFSADLAEGEEFDFVNAFDSAPKEVENNVYVFFNDADGTRKMINTTALSFKDGSAAAGLYASFDATYSWLRSEEDAFEAKPAGDSKTFEIDSYYNLVNSKGEELATASGEGLGDWYTVSFANSTNDEPAKMTVTVSALPEGTDVRSSYFDVEVFGMMKRFYVAQRSESGVSGLTASATKAFVNGGNIEVSSPKATSVAVYNVAGQKVAEQAFAGNATIKASNLAKGIYVLKFNDNTVLKLTK